MIKGEITGGKEALAYLNGVAPRLSSKLDQTIAQLTIKLQRNVVSTKLQGQVLNVGKNGRLQRSINQQVTGQGTGAVTGSVGTNVVYARVHEYGFHGQVSVKEHLRMVTQAFGREVKEPRQVTVRAHSMNMNMPERSFLRSALRDMTPEIKAQIQAAVTESIRK